MPSVDLRFMQVSLTPEEGNHLPGVQLYEAFRRMELLTMISSVPEEFRCMVRIEYTEPNSLQNTYETMEVVRILEDDGTVALAEVLLSGPLPKLFQSLEHAWWVSPTVLNNEGFTFTIRGTKDALVNIRNRLPALFGRGFSMKLGAQSVYNPEFIELLPARQRTVLDKAIELGYYDRPRGCTQRMIADALNIKQATVSEHLQSAESTIIHAFANEP